MIGQGKIELCFVRFILVCEEKVPTFSFWWRQISNKFHLVGAVGLLVDRLDQKKFEDVF